MTSRRLAATAMLAVASFTILAGCSGDDEPTGSAAGPGTAPPSSTADTALTVQPSAFEVTYRLDGIVASSPVVGIDVPPGTQFTPAVTSGTHVLEGGRLGSLEIVETADDRLGGTVEESRRRLAMARSGEVTAPVAGTVQVDGGAARVETAGLDVVVTLQPLQELRYRALEFSGTATVETVLGQRQSECMAVWLEALPAASDDADSVATSAVHCRLPPHVETAAGLPAVLTLTSSRQADVIAVPLIYIGLDATGQDYIARIREGAAVVDRAVVVGVTDGVRRVIAEGLESGDALIPVSSP